MRQRAPGPNATCVGARVTRIGRGTCVLAPPAGLASYSRLVGCKNNGSLPMKASRQAVRSWLARQRALEGWPLAGRGYRDAQLGRRTSRGNP